MNMVHRDFFRERRESLAFDEKSWLETRRFVFMEKEELKQEMLEETVETAEKTGRKKKEKKSYRKADEED